MVWDCVTIATGSLILLNLGSEVEADIAELTDGVFGDERDVGGEGERDGRREGSGLGEGNELPERKGQRHVSREVDRGGSALLERREDYS